MTAGRKTKAVAWIALVAFALAAAATAETRREESVGVAPIRDGDDAPRDQAMAEAVRGAVVNVAKGLLPAGFVPPDPGVGEDGLPEEPDAWLAKRLGEDPFVYVTRIRMLEDRGRQEAMFATDPEVEEEYVVLADVTVDVDAVRERLAELGLLRPSSPGTRRSVTLVVQGLSHPRPLRILREVLEDDGGVESVVPIEFTRDRAVLAVRSNRDAPALVDALETYAPEELQIVVVDQRAREATLLIDWRPPPPPGDEDVPGNAESD